MQRKIRADVLLGWLMAIGLIACPSISSAQAPGAMVYEEHAMFRPGALLGSDIVHWASEELIKGTDASPQTSLSLEMVQAIREAVLGMDRRKLLGCRSALPKYGDGSWTEPGTPLGMFLANEVSLVGVVEEVVPGYNFFNSRVESLIRIRVEEVLVDGEGIVAPGQKVLVLDPSGAIDFPGARLCTEKPKGVYVSRVGDRVGAVGTHQRPLQPQQSDISLCYFCLFEVEDQKSGQKAILPNEVPQLSQKKVSLEEIRQAVAAQMAQP